MLKCSCETLMPSSFRTRRPHVLATLAFHTIFVQALSTGARAEIQITGESDAIKVEAKEASVEELLTALRKAYGLQYWSSANLNQSVSGTFAGSLEQVVSRALVLQGYDFIAETSAQGTIVAVYGKSTAPVSTVAMAPQAAPVPKQPAPLPSRPTSLPPHVDGRGLAHGPLLNQRRMRDPRARL